jgi:hypothetical protein
MMKSLKPAATKDTNEPVLPLLLSPKARSLTMEQVGWSEREGMGLS